MRSSTWLAVIGVSVLTFIILVITGSISFKVADKTAEDDNNAKIAIVREIENPQTEKTVVLDGLNG